MITTVTMNPALDKTIMMDTLAKGQVNRVGRVREDMGGKGINVGRILNGFGVPTMNLAFLGKENKDHVLEYFRNEAMAIDYIPVEGYTRTNIKIVEVTQDQTTDINENGFSVEREDYGKFMEKLEGLGKHSDYLIMSGSMARGLPVMTYGNVTRLYKNYTRVVIDAEGEALSEGLKGGPFMVKPNIDELEKLLNRTIGSLEEVVIAGRELISTYGLTYALISRGDEGSVLVSKNESYSAGIIPTNVMSTVGAGDALLAGFIYALSRKKTMEECLRFGTACSHLRISKEGYYRIDIDDVYDKSRLVIAEKVDEEGF